MIWIKVAKNEWGEIVYCHPSRCLEPGIYYHPETAQPLKLCQRRGQQYFAVWKPLLGRQESSTHLQAKKDLWEWIHKEIKTSYIEYYLNELQQRPDIMVEYAEKRWALEYQCSFIPYELMEARSSGYEQYGMGVIWLLGPHFQKVRRMTKFLEKASFYHEKLGYFLCFFSDNQLEIRHHIHFEKGKQNYCYQSIRMPLKQIGAGHFFSLLNEDCTPQLTCFKVKQMTAYQIAHCKRKSSNRAFILTLWKFGLVLEDLPAFCWTESCYSLLFQEPVYHYRGYLWLYFLRRKSLSSIYIKELEKLVQWLIDREWLHPRKVKGWGLLLEQELREFMMEVQRVTL